MMLDNKVTTPGTLLIRDGKIYIDGWELEKPGMCREHVIFACLHSAQLLLKAATEDVAAPGGAKNSYADMPNETPREWLGEEARAFLDMCDGAAPRRKPLVIKVSDSPADLPDAECYTPLDVNGHEHAVYVVTKSNEASGGDPTRYGQQIIAALVGRADLQAEVERLKEERDTLATDLRDENDRLRAQLDANKQPVDGDAVTICDEQYLPISSVIERMSLAINVAIAYRSMLVTIDEPVSVSAVRHIEKLQADNELLKLAADDANLSCVAAQEERDLLRKDRDQLKSCEIVMKKALTKIANYTQSKDLLWWQIEARQALDKAAPLHTCEIQSTCAACDRDAQPLPGAQSPQFSDSERLNFMVKQQAFIVTAMGLGQVFQLWDQDEDEEFHILSGHDQEWFNTERDAIDAAMERYQKLAGGQ